MKKSLNSCVWILFFVLIAFNSICCAQNKVVEEQKETKPIETSREPNDFFKRLNTPRFANYYASASWTLTHDYSDSKRVDEVLKTVKEYFSAFEKNERGDRTELDRLGGVKSFKDKLAVWLNDDDQAIRAFAAVLLGISGDKSYALQLANLLKERKYKERDYIHYDKARAAMALGMIGATEFTEQLAEMLKSKESYDRAGAAIGLGYLRAKSKIEAIKKLTTDKDEEVRKAAQESLMLMEE